MRVQTNELLAVAATGKHALNPNKTCGHTCLDSASSVTSEAMNLGAVALLSELIRASVREELESARIAFAPPPAAALSSHVDVKEARVLLRCSDKTVRRMVDRGLLKKAKLGLGEGSKLLISRESIDQVLGGV
ncbi:MAG: helix-turn-helix domain-containing protein [Myxococcales bacterium]